MPFCKPLHIISLTKEQFFGLTKASKQQMRDNIKKGYIYVVLPPGTLLTNLEKSLGKILLHLKVENDYEDLFIEATPGIHVLEKGSWLRCRDICLIL